jgi:hypothetical protein
VSPRDQATWDAASQRVQSELGTLAASMQGMIQDLRGNAYAGCTKANYADVARRLDRLNLRGGFKQTGSLITNLLNLRKTLILELKKRAK